MNAMPAMCQALFQTDDSCTTSDCMRQVLLLSSLCTQGNRDTETSKNLPKHPAGSEDRLSGLESACYHASEMKGRQRAGDCPLAFSPEGRKQLTLSRTYPLGQEE